MATPERFTQANHFLYYSDLHYISEEQKQDPLWAAACLMFSKFNNRQLVSSAEVKREQEFDEGGFSEDALKQVFDPIDPTNKEGGKATFVTTDWKACPIYIHLNNIVETSMEKIPINLYCKAIDEYAMLKQQKENQKILGRNEFMKFINEFNAKLGFPKLKSVDDPFRYVESMGKAAKPKDGGGMQKGVVDAPTSLLDTIKAAINDNEDLALFNEFIYKGDVEIAIELGLLHYFKINKFNLIGEQWIADIRKHNRAIGRWYTSQTSGKPVMEYLRPDLVYVSPFNQPDGSDISSFFFERDIPFGDFVRTFGRGLDKKSLERIFDLNKTRNAAHGLSWAKCSISQRNSASIRIGYHEWESQDCKVYSEGQRKGNLRFRPAPYEWKPSMQTAKEYRDVRTERHYNVWYKCYYIPMSVGPTQDAIALGDFISQAEYIFDFGKLTDQQRYGENDRECKSSFVTWKRKGMSFADIMNRYMPKIHFLWQKYQNYIAQTDVFAVFADELVNSMLKLAEQQDPNNKEVSKMDFLKQLLQTGRGYSEMTNAKGDKIDPVRHFTAGFGAAALDALNQMRVLYNEMTMALAISDTREGIDPKPRTSLGGLKLSLAASNNGTFFIEKGYMDMVLEMGNRMKHYMDQIVREGESERLQHFRDIVGLANSMAYEAIGDIPNHRMGLYIDNVNTDEQKQYLLQLCQKLVEAQQLDIEALQLIIKIENYKYAAVLMIMKYKQKQRQIQEAKDREFAQIMAAKEKDLQIESAKYTAKAQAQTITIDREGQWDMKIQQMLSELKSQGQAMMKEIIKNNRIEENVVNKQLEGQTAA